MDIYSTTGKMALGSRLRRLSEQFTEQAAGIYELYQVDLQPRWFPVFYCLATQGERSIMDIAREIGHTHPSVSQIVREMAAQGFVTEKKGQEDGRKNFIVLADKGWEAWEKMQPQIADVSAAVEQAMTETHHDLWRALGEWEFLLEQKDLLQRVREEKKRREARDIAIVDCTPEHYQAFHDLNEEWISRYFKMEESDHKALDHPKEYILDKGGVILVALHKEQPVGTCALIPLPGEAPTFELAKMAVSPAAQGLGIGLLLGQACIERARALGAKRVYLESNTRLKPALSLYHKLGFRKVVGPPSPYERADIQMDLWLE